MTLVLSLVSLLAPVFAAEPAEPTSAASNVRYQAVTDLTFEDIEIEGKIQRPENVLVLERRRATFNPLIRLRADFDAEMAQSLDLVR
jgi:hypothetical protein